MSSTTRFRNYDQACAYLRRHTDYERMSGVRYTPRNFNLVRMHALLDRLGHPERAFRSIHVAGTKGKGSVCMMIEAALRAAGYRTGLYTSPHLVDMLERIQIDGCPIARQTFTATMARIRPEADRVRPTYFEIMTAAAFVAFQKAGVDWAVVEVGLGGRLDSTNVIRPEAAVITTVDYDHTDVLGHTLRAIAREKAGIIKREVPVICASQHPEAMKIISLTSRTKDAPLYIIGRDFHVRHVHERYTRARDRLTFDGSMKKRAMNRIRLSLAGRHQAMNAGLALGTLAVLEDRGLTMKASAIRRAFRSLVLPGRLHRIPGKPYVLVDAAHNPVSSGALRDYLTKLPGFRRRILVFGSAKDKDARSMLEVLLHLFDRVIFTRSNSPRAMDTARLISTATSVRPQPYLEASNFQKAMEIARSVAAPRDLVVVTGSFYLAGEAIKHLQNQKG